jgi:hypothetical protein
VLELEDGDAGLRRADARIMATVTGNTADPNFGSGGGIYNAGQVTIQNSTIVSGNTSFELDADALAAAERMGFERMGHHRESVLDLDMLDVEAAEVAAARAAANGVELRPLPDDAGDAEWQRLYDEVVAPTWRDAPDAEGGAEVVPLQVFRAFFPHGHYVLVAWDGDRPVGVTAVMDRAKDDALNTMFTGVVAGSRGSGLSTGLKARHALDMKARGHHRLFTQNMDQNARILAANDRLGFTVVPGYFAMGRPVTAAASAGGA